MLFLGMTIGIFAGILFCISALVFIIWAMHEHLVARKYRQLVKLAALAHVSSARKSNQWTITYKDGSKVQTTTVPGDTEAGALLNLAKQGVRYSAIISSVKG